MRICLRAPSDILRPCQDSPNLLEAGMKAEEHRARRQAPYTSLSVTEDPIQLHAPSG